MRCKARFNAIRGGHRRLLTPSQNAMVAERARAWYDAEAKKRQRQHGATVPEKRKTIRADLQEVTKGDGDPRTQVAKDFGVSDRLVDHATRLWRPDDET
jgi:hypothetical protein